MSLLSSFSLWLLTYREDSFHLCAACFRLIGWKKWWICNNGHFMISRSVLSAFFKFLGIFVCVKIRSSYGIHQLPKVHPQRTIQSAVIIPYLFPTCKSTVQFICLFSVLIIICLQCSIECLSKNWVLTKLKYNFSAYLLILHARIILLSFYSKYSCSWRCGCQT